jgi:hypothetical protein
VLVTTPVHPSAGETPVLTIEDAPANISVTGVLFGRNPAITLSVGGGRRVVVHSRPGVGPDITSVSALGLSKLSASLPAGSVLPIDSGCLFVPLNTLYSHSGDLRIPAPCAHGAPPPVTLNDGYLYVDGNATLVGALRGSGAIVASGSLTVTGPIHLQPASHPAVALHGDDVISFTRDVLGMVSAQPGHIATRFGLGASLIGWDGLDLG